MGMREDKAGYMATPVTCGLAGAIIEVTPLFRQEQWRQKPQKKNQKKLSVTDGPMDRWTNEPTDGPTKWVVESRSTQLKKQTNHLGGSYSALASREHRKR